MIRKTKLAALAGTAAVFAALVPAGPAAAMSACQVKSLGVHSEIGQIVAVAGVYKGPTDALDVQLTCGIVRFGVTVARVSDDVPGPVAALADVVGVPSGPISSCYEVKIVHVDGSVTYYDTCP